MTPQAQRQGTGDVEAARSLDEDAYQLRGAAQAGRRGRCAACVWTVYTYSATMSGQIDNGWVAQCARRLRERWPHADLVTLEETAIELWRDERLRSMEPVEAAVRWLSPLPKRGRSES